MKTKDMIETKQVMMNIQSLEGKKLSKEQEFQLKLMRIWMKEELTKLAN